MSADPRVRAYADLLLDRSLGVQPGWQVLLVTTVEARPFAEELARGVARRGAYVLPRISFGAWYPLDVAWAEAAPEEVALRLAPLEQDVVDRVDGSIFVIAPADPPLDAEISPLAKKSLRAQLTFYRARGRAGEAPEVRCDFPTPWFARQAGLSLEEYEDVFYDACLRDWDAEAERMRPVLERFDRAEEVRIVGDGTDLRLSLAGRSGAMDAGHVNVPGGEVYYCPVEDSVEGEIMFDFPSGHGRAAAARPPRRARSSRRRPRRETRPCSRRSTRMRAPGASASSASAATTPSRATCATSSSTRRWPARCTSPSARASRASAAATRARCTGTSSRTCAAAASSTPTASSSSETGDGSSSARAGVASPPRPARPSMIPASITAQPVQPSQPRCSSARRRRRGRRRAPRA